VKEAVWEKIARLLKAEGPLSNREVARRLRVSVRSVAAVREDLGIPKYWIGCRPAWDLARFEASTVRVAGGHRRWKGNKSPDGTPLVGNESAYRVAFRLHFGREPVGRLNRSCQVFRCVEGRHQRDRVMRDEARGVIETLTDLPVGGTYRGMDLVAIRRALRGRAPYPPLRPEERKFAAPFADPEMTTEDLARRLGCCPESARRWREKGVPACG
jgi:hypothetical protein